MLLLAGKNWDSYTFKFKPDESIRAKPKLLLQFGS